MNDARAQLLERLIRVGAISPDAAAQMRFTIDSLAPEFFKALANPLLFKALANPNQQDQPQANQQDQQ